MKLGTLTMRLLAATLIVALQALYVPVLAEPASATLQGVVLAGGELAPLTGATVYAGNPETGEVYPSTSTGADGSFRVRGLPPATYEVAVESAGGLYLVETPVSLAPGASRSVDIALHAEAKGEGGGGGGIGGAVKAPGLWNNPFTAALIVLGIAAFVGVAVDKATEDNDTEAEVPASKFAP